MQEKKRPSKAVKFKLQHIIKAKYLNNVKKGIDKRKTIHNKSK